MFVVAHVGQRRRRHVRTPRPRLPQGAVLPVGLDRVPHRRRRHRAHARAIGWTWSRGRPTRRPSDRVGADASRPPGEGRVPRRPAVVQRARRHRHLREGDARGPPGSRPLVGARAVPVEMASGRFRAEARRSRRDGRYPGVEVPHSIRTLYPSWDTLGRPALPASLDDAAIVHATNPAAVPPVHGDQRLVVTVHDLAFERFPELFPRDWRWLYRAGLRAAVKRADAILVPSQSTADDLIASTSIPASRVHVTPLGSSLVDWHEDRAGGVRAPPGDAAVRVVGRNARAAQEPGAAGARVPAGRTRRPAHARAGGRAADGTRTRWTRSSRGPAPGPSCGPNEVSDGELDVLYRGADVFAYPSLYEGFGLPVVEAMARGVPTLTSDTSVAPRGRRRRRAPGGSDGRLRDRRGPRPAAHRSRVRGGSAATRPAARGDVHVGGDGARYARRLPAADGSVDVVKVSLISTVKDASAHVEEFMGSVAAQTRAPDEVIVVDGGSTDGTPDLLRRAGVEGIDRDRRARREHRARPQRGDRRGGARRDRRDRRRLRARPAVARADPGADRGRRRRVDGLLRPHHRRVPAGVPGVGEPPARRLGGRPRELHAERAFGRVPARRRSRRRAATRSGSRSARTCG